MRNTLRDEKVAAQLDPAERKRCEEAVRAAIEWCDANGLAEKEEFEDKLRELEGLCGPVMTRMYQGGSGAQPGGAASGAPGGAGPRVEEVD